MQPDSITYTMYRFATCMVTLGCRSLLKILPSSQSTATWCIMVNVSMWSLYLLLPIRSGVLNITIVMIKKVTHFNGKIPSFYNMVYT